MIAARIEAIHSLMCWIPSFKRMEETWIFFSGEFQWINKRTQKRHLEGLVPVRGRHFPLENLSSRVALCFPAVGLNFAPSARQAQSVFSLPSCSHFSKSLLIHPISLLKEIFFLFFNFQKVTRIQAPSPWILTKMLIVVDWFQWIHLKNK